ncbi:MAG: hypothetical protein ACI89Z_000626 [Porticoccus sp.]|jgi:hypothetical protein
MKIQRLPSGLRMILLISTVLAIAGCNDIAATARKFTYPQDFNYASDQEFRSQMEQLKFQLQVLDKALVKGNTEQPSQQQYVLDALCKMERIGSSLKAGDVGLNHPFLQGFIEDFLPDVGESRTTASRDPANYYRTGRVAGGCINCD